MAFLIADAFLHVYIVLAWEFNCNDGDIDETNGAFSVINDALFFSTVVYKLFQEYYWITPIKGKIMVR